MLLFKGSRDQLLAPLQSVCGIVEKRHTLPILSNVLLESDEERLTLLATDIEIQIRTYATEGATKEVASLTVAARKLQDILRSLPESAEVNLSLDDKRLQLRAGKSRFNLQTLPAAGSYDWAFYIAGILLIVAILIALVTKRPEYQKT